VNSNFDESRARITTELCERMIDNVRIVDNVLWIFTACGKMARLQAQDDHKIALVDALYISHQFKQKLNLRHSTALQHHFCGKIIDYVMEDGYKLVFVTKCGHELTFQADTQCNIHYLGMGVTVRLKSMDIFGIQGVIG